MPIWRHNILFLSLCVLIPLDHRLLRRRQDHMSRPMVDLITRALEEDGAYADITTQSTVPGDRWSKGRILARKSGVIAGLTVACETFQVFDERIQIEQVVHDGAHVQANDDL